MNKVKGAANHKRTILLSLVAGSVMAGLASYTPDAGADAGAVLTCTGDNTVTADVVAIDQPIMFNRLGAQNINYMVYALRRDVVDTVSNLPLTNGGNAAYRGLLTLRADKRPRPLVLRVAAGDCLEVHLQNLLTDSANPFEAPLVEGEGEDDGHGGRHAGPDGPIMQINNQVAGRQISFHPLGLQLVSDIDLDDGSFVGKNASSLLVPGASGIYKYYAEAEGAFMVYSRGQPFGGEASGGNVGVGLFGVVNVEPAGAEFYRSQLTEEEMRLATIGTVPINPCADGTEDCNPGGQPIIDYAAVYPSGEPWASEGKTGLPIVNMLTAGNEIVHSDINAIIAGPDSDGTWESKCPGEECPYPLEKVGKRNPTVPNRLEAFREFTVVFHDEQAATQAFPKWFNDPVLTHTLHGVRDSFMINYGSGGIGSEIIANRLGVGPMHDCLNCAYEEFFLTAYTVGDVAMLVDRPANTGLELCSPALEPDKCFPPRVPATQAFFPEDPSNVHHSYKNDFVKFRNLHAGPKEQHIFHLHNHQWLFNANDDNSNYLDAQGIGPGSGYTYEINFGGSGNRNKSAGDAIFHCHFYPHFAQGMWEMWRIHDVMETGTVLAASGGIEGAPGIHAERFALQNGLPAGDEMGSWGRALPDGEIIAGTPIPALVPLPSKAMAPMPGKVIVVPKDADGIGGPDSSQAYVDDRSKNPGYPFWIAGIEITVGQRPTTPPLDMLTEDEADALKATGDPLWDNMSANLAGGFNGGLPRHTLEGYLAGGASDAVQNRLDFTKTITEAKPVYFPETGTDLEQLVMRFNAQRYHPSCSVGLDGTLLCDGDELVMEDSTTIAFVDFVANGNLPVPSAPYYDPCIDDEGELFVHSIADGTPGPFKFFSSTPGGFFEAPAPRYGALNPRVYKGANVQIDAVFNKAGYHFPQQRIIALWDDVIPTINKQRPPEHTNLVPEYYELDDYQVRTPTDIIGQHIHLPKWDLVANDGSGNGWNYEDGTLSPGAVRERIHAINNFLHPELALLSEGDAAARCDEIHTEYLADTSPEDCLHPKPHQYPAFSGDSDWVGARTTIQRWFTDPVVNVDLEDRGLGIIFTHDHYGPSTHQQVGLYATILAEPANSVWVHNETGEPLGTRLDGGPTSWQAQILTDTNDDEVLDAGFREFYFEFADFQHAYKKGVYVGADEFGKPLVHGPVPVGPDGNLLAAHGGVSPDSFRSSINPSFRQQANPNGPDIVRFPPTCPGTRPDDPETLDINEEVIILRPCAEAISADDVGMLVVNYRNEPIGLRVYDPEKLGPDNKLGMQADGLGGDLAFALQTRTDRAIPAFNTALGDTPYLAGLNSGIKPGDPFTPMIRAYPTDTVKIKIQSGATEHEHNATIHGIKWLQGGSGHGVAPNSGWRNSQNDGISEQFTFSAPVNVDPGNAGSSADYAYTMDASQDGWWSGTWGVMRTYENKQMDLARLPSNLDPRADKVKNKHDFNGVCPIDAPERNYQIVAMTANELLGNDLKQHDGSDVKLVPTDSTARMHVGAKVDSFGNPVPSNDLNGISAIDPAGGTLVYNNRPTKIRQLDLTEFDLPILGGQSGPLHDPTALMYVFVDDLEPDPLVGDQGENCTATARFPGVVRASCQVRLKPQAPVEPAVLRANAGDCINVTLFNRLPMEAPDLGGFNTLLQVVNRDHDDPQGMTTFNNNLIRPSSHVGIHPQLVEYDVTRHDGTNVGRNPGVQTVVPVGYTDATDYYDDDLDGTINLYEDDVDNDGIVNDLDKDYKGPRRKYTYTWYAGDLKQKEYLRECSPTRKGKGKRCEGKRDEVELIATGVEFGGFNLQPADKIKQGQKGLIGAGVIEPVGATWPSNLTDLVDYVDDHQVPYVLDSNARLQRKTRTIATVTYPDPDYPATTLNYRDATVIFQKALNHRFGDGSAVPNIASEGEGIPEDSHDAGQVAINYGSEPMWFRYGMPADSPFEQVGLGGVQNSHEAFSNICCTSGGLGDTSTTADQNVGDPVTPIFTAAPGQGLRMRLLEPTGVGRGTTFNLHGHAWQRAPYIAGEGADGVPSQTIGDNWLGMILGHQESITPAAHFDIVPLNGAGGINKVKGDYLFNDQGSFGTTGGLWGILRVED